MTTMVISLAITTTTALATRAAIYLHRVGLHRAWLRLTLRVWSWRTYGIRRSTRARHAGR